MRQAMTDAEARAAMQRILNGERATLVVLPENLERARELAARLPQKLRERLTLATTKEG